MNSTTNTELAKVADTSQVGALALISLSPEKYTKEVYQPFNDQLAAAINSVRAVDYDIKTTAGMAVAIKCRAIFRDMRVAADKERKARKDPITKIGKLLESGFDQVEERITPLEELFDADIKAEEARKEVEKAAKIAAERARIERIADAIAGLREGETDALRICKTAEAVRLEIEYVEAKVISEEIYQERHTEALEVHASVLASMRATLAVRIEAEAEAARQQAEREAAEAKAKQEREELAAAQAKLKADQDAAAAELKRQQAEAQAEMQRQRDAMAAQMKAEREKAEALRKLEDDKRRLEQQAQAEAARIAKAEQDRIAAEHVQKMAEQQAVMDARQRDLDHAEGLMLNAQFDQLAAARRLEQETAAVAETVAAVVEEGPQEARAAFSLLCNVIESEQAKRPTDDKIARTVAEAFSVDIETATEWLLAFGSAEF